MTTVAETFETPSSSNIASFSYDPSTETLTVNFRNDDAYDYFNVPTSVYRAFCQAGSHGQFHARHIKGRYAYEKQ